MSCLHHDPAASFTAYEACLRPVVAERQRRARAISPADWCRPRAPARASGVWPPPWVGRDSFVPLLRWGFDDTSSILPSPHDNEKETIR